MKKLLLITLIAFGITLLWSANLTGSLPGTPGSTSPETTSLPAAPADDESYTITFDKQGGIGGLDEATATIGYAMPLATAPASRFWPTN